MSVTVIVWLGLNLCKAMFSVKGYRTVDGTKSARTVFFREQKCYETVSLRVSGFALAAPIVLRTC